MDNISITKSMEGDTLTITIEGRVTSTNAAMITAKTKDEYKNAVNIRLDAEKMEYIASSGLRQLKLLSFAAKNNGGGLKILRPNSYVQEVFETTGFDSLMEIEKQG